jgi:hypothetical protein
VRKGTRQETWKSAPCLESTIVTKCEEKRDKYERARRVTNGVIYSVLEPHVVSPLFLIQAGESSHPYASQIASLYCPHFARVRLPNQPVKCGVLFRPSVTAPEGQKSPSK